MKINDTIRTRRQALGLTQEGLAAKVGVSAPAVNKWEKGLNYPDITLLPTLARTLGVDLNTLLSFQEDISREEIGCFLNQVTALAQAEGCAAAFSLAWDKLREFPNSDLLAYNVACILEGVLTLWPGGDGDELETWRGEIAALYERCAHSADAQVRGWGNYMLLSRSISQGALEQAEALLEQLPDTHRGKPDMKAALRRKQGRREEAWQVLEEELLDQASTIQTTLMSMLDLALEEGDGAGARLLAEKAAETGRVLQLMPYAADAAPFQLAVAQEDGPAALEILERLLPSMTEPWDLSAAPLYRHLPVKEGAREGWALIRSSVLDEVERDPKCAFLRREPGYEALVARYRALSSCGDPLQQHGGL